MLVNLLNAAGERTEAALLAIGENRMRVVVRGLKDATELRFINERWLSENGVAVDIESLIMIAATNVERPRTMTAGS